jgi:hypothetical protein
VRTVCNRCVKTSSQPPATAADPRCEDGGADDDLWLELGDSGEDRAEDWALVVGQRRARQESRGQSRRDGVACHEELLATRLVSEQTRVVPLAIGFSASQLTALPEEAGPVLILDPHLQAIAVRIGR